MLMSKFARGLSLAVATKAPLVSTRQFGDMPALDVSASHDPVTGQSAVFVANRSQTETLSTDIIWQSEAPRQIAGGPMDGNTQSLQLPPLSFTVVSTC